MRGEATAKLPGKQERRAHAEAGTRADQAALDVESEQRRGQDARAASLADITRLLSVRDKVEEKRDSLVSFMFAVDEDVLILAQSSPTCFFSKNGFACKICSMHKYGAQVAEASSGGRPTHLAVLLLLLLLCRGHVPT